uniref:Uncharacterized protein n=1 Tax=Panagrolaimus superbus TaxID=310955 RepID=A0A914Z7S1_9BILA
MDRPQLRLVPQSSNGPRIVLLHPTGVPPQPSLIPRVVAQNGPRLPAPQTIPSNVPPRLDSQTPPKHLKHVRIL